MSEKKPNNEVLMERLRLIEYLSSCKPGSEEYDKAAAQLKTFTEIEAQIQMLRPKTFGEKILGNAPLLGGLFTTLISLLMLNYEQANTITSQVRNHIKTRI